MQTEDAKVSTNISNELIDQLPLVVGGAMRSVFDLVQHDPRSQGQRHQRRPRRRPGRRVRRDARWHLGEHEPQRGCRRDRVPDAVCRSDHRVLGRDQRLQARVRPGRRRRDYVRVEVGHEPVQGLARTTSSATTPSTRKASSSSARASIDRTTSAGRWAVQSISPRLYDGQNKTFFFAAYEGFRNNQASNATTLSVPTPEMYNGDFSNWVDSQGRLLVIYDPATTRPNPNGTGFIRDPFPGNRFPPTGSATSRGNTSRSRDRRSCRIDRASCPAHLATSPTTSSRRAARRWRRPTSSA